MGPKGNIIMGVLVIAVSLVVLALCSSTAFQDYILELVKGGKS
jgi:hypothetical protein